jgi:hypothetical protein
MLYFVIGCLIIGLFISFSIGWWCGEWHVRRNTMVGTPSTSTNSVRDAILLADEYHITTRSYSKEEAAIAGFKRWLRAKQHP